MSENFSGVFLIPHSLTLRTRNNLQIENLSEFNAGKAAFQCSGCIISRCEFIINVKSTFKAPENKKHEKNNRATAVLVLLMFI